MKKLLMAFGGVSLALGMYLAWNWVNQIQEPTGVTAKDNTLSLKRSKAPAPSRADSIRLAVISPPRRPIPDEGPNVALPVQFCLDRINAAGGIKSTPIDLLVLESENSALDSARAAQEAVESGAVAVIGGYTSSGALGSAEVLQKARIPMIAVGATNPDVTQVGDYIFRVNFVDSFQGAALAEFAYRDLGARRAGLLVNVGNRYSPYLAEVFAEQFGQLGGEVVWHKDYLPGSSEYAYLFADGRAMDMDMVFVPGYEDDSAQILQTARASGIKARFLGGDGWGPAMFDYAGEVVQDGYYTKAWHPDAGLVQGLRDVLESWTEKWGPVRRDVTVLTLDACSLLFSAMERAKDFSPASIREALAETEEFKGMAGVYSFRLQRDPDKPLAVLRMTRPEPALVRVIHPRKVKLGVIFAKTGEAAQVNAMAFEAARYAAEEINRLGGVMGHRLELIEYDNESTVLGSRKAALQAVRDQVAAVIGASWSSHSSAMAPILQEARIPMVTPISTSPEVTRIGDCIFRACYTDRLQGRLLAEFALEELKARRAAVLINANSEYSLGLARCFRDRFSEKGQVILELDYLQSTTDFRSLLEKVQAAQPDVVFVPGYPRDSVYIIRQARQMGIQGALLGADGWNDVMYEYAGGELEGNFYSQHWHPEVPDERSRAFYERYSRKHSAFRGGLVALTYDTVRLIADAVRRAGSIQAEDIRAALAGTKDFQGITGRIEFDENRDPRSKPLVMVRFGKDKSEFYKWIHSNHPRDSRE